MTAWLHEHVAQLCGDLGIEWTVGCPRSEASAGLTTIETPPIGGQQAYFTALHEIAHVVYQHQARGDIRVLEQEAQAWRWAFEHALVGPNPGTVKRIRRDLASYWLRANTDKRMTTEVPEFKALWSDLQKRVPRLL